jgi:hypothetical protein
LLRVVRLNLAGELSDHNIRITCVILRYVEEPLEQQDPSYKGVPLESLRINGVEWPPDRAAHIQTREERKERKEHDIEPEWATEAATDPHRMLRLPDAEKPETQALIVIGYSPSCDRILRVFIWSDDPESSDVWNGGTAAVAGRSTVRRYWRERGEEDEPRT